MMDRFPRAQLATPDGKGSSRCLHTRKAPDKHSLKHNHNNNQSGSWNRDKLQSEVRSTDFLSKRTGQQNATRCSLCKSSLRRVRRLGRPQHHGVARPTGVATCPTAWATPQLPLEPPRCSLRRLIPFVLNGRKRHFCYLVARCSVGTRNTTAHTTHSRPRLGPLPAPRIRSSTQPRQRCSSARISVVTAFHLHRGCVCRVWIPHTLTRCHVQHTANTSLFHSRNAVGALADDEARNRGACSAHSLLAFSARHRFGLSPPSLVVPSSSFVSPHTLGASTDIRCTGGCFIPQRTTDNHHRTRRHACTSTQSHRHLAAPTSLVSARLAR